MLLRALLLAALALAVTASPSHNRKLLQPPVGCKPNVCTKNGVSNGCLTAKGGKQYACVDLGHGVIDATECTDGSVCDPEKLFCVTQPDNSPCAGRADGCYHFSHHDGMCIGGQQSLCPNLGPCNAAGTACEQPAQDNACTQNKVTNGCLVTPAGEFACTTKGSGHTQATECLAGTTCDMATLTCVPEQPDDGPCAGRADGCYHFSHHDGMCTGGQQSLCPDLGSCNADGTACEGSEDDPNAKCAGKRDGCYTGHNVTYYTCRNGTAADCPAGTHCSSAALDATCV